MKREERRLRFNDRQLDLHLIYFLTTKIQTMGKIIQNIEKTNMKKLSNGNNQVDSQKSEIIEEDSYMKIRVIPEEDGISHKINGYTSDYTNISSDNHFRNKLSGKLPTLPEARSKKFLNKSVPKLSHPKIPVAGKTNYRKRKLNINKIASNLNTKD